MADPFVKKHWLSVSPRYAHQLNVLLLVTVSLLVFANCLNTYFFVVDDLNQIVRGLSGDIAGVLFLNTYGAQQGGNYRPIEPFSHFVDVYLWGVDNAAGRRLTNLIVHVLNVVLLYAIGFHLTGRRIVALTAGLLFAVHPLHAQALPPVAWLSGRPELFVTLFFLLAVLLFMRAVTKRSYGLYFLSLLAFVLALLSKELAVTLPLVILAYWVVVHWKAGSDRWLSEKHEMLLSRLFLGAGLLALGAGVMLSPDFVRRYLSPDGILDPLTLVNLHHLRLLAIVGGAGAALYGLLSRQQTSPVLTAAKLVSPYFVVLALYFIVRMWVLGTLGGAYQSAGGNVIFDISPAAFLRDVLALAGLFWPVGINYNIVVFALQIEHPVIFYGLSSLALLVVGTILITSFRSSRVAGFGVIWIAITLMPMHNILIPSWQYQARYLYLPAVGFCLGLSVLVHQLSQSGKPSRKLFLTVGLAALILSSAIATVRYNAALAKSGEIARALVSGIKGNGSGISAQSELMILTVPLSAIDTRYAYITTYMRDVLFVGGESSETPYHFLLFLEGGEKSKVDVTRLQDGGFLVELSGQQDVLWMPLERSPLERRIQDIWGLLPPDVMLQPLPPQGTVETNKARISVLSNDQAAGRVRVKIALKSTSGSHWFVYDREAFRPIGAP